VPAPQLVSAQALDNVTVEVVYDQAMVVNAAYLDPASYSVDGGLFVLNVVDSPTNPGESVMLTTTAQVGDRAYVLTVSSALQQAAGPNAYLDPLYSSSAFVGIASPDAYVVTNLVARTHPAGGTIDLFWDNPQSPAPTHTKIIRRLRTWAFTKEDAGTVVYNGAALTSAADVPKITDTGLLEERYYYYQVFVRVSPANYVQGVRTYGLSGYATATLNSKEIIKRRFIPKTYITNDLKPPQDGELDKYLTLIGGFTDLMRSHIGAVRLLADDEEAPDPFLDFKSRSRGFEPEGDAYDYDTKRRVLLQLQELWQRRATEPGVVQAVYALVLWLCEVYEFGAEPHTRLLMTYDPAGPREDHVIPEGIHVGTLEDTVSGVTWADHLWQDARLLDSMGNWIDVADNSGGDTLTFAALPPTGRWRRLVTANAAAGDTTLFIDSVLGLQVGQRVQVYDPTAVRAQVVEIVFMDPATGEIRFWNELRYNFTTANGCTVGFDIYAPEAAMIGRTSGGVVDELELDLPASGVLKWITGQWIGFEVKGTNNVTRVVVDSDASKMYFDDGGVFPSGLVRIARSFDGSNNPELHYAVMAGRHEFLFDPTFDHELRGTRLDPYSYLFGGTAPLEGQFGPCDLGIFITSDVTVATSRVSSFAGSVLTDVSANYTTNELVGLYLNPNQNQDRMFPIVANTATTITVGSDLGAFARVNQAYFVLTARDATRYQRLRARIVEFMPDGLCPRILFF
jgi:hypothetical protein